MYSLGKWMGLFFIALSITACTKSTSICVCSFSRNFWVIWISLSWLKLSSVLENIEFLFWTVQPSLHKMTGVLWFYVQMTFKYTKGKCVCWLSSILHVLFEYFILAVWAFIICFISVLIISGFFPFNEGIIIFVI